MSTSTNNSEESEHSHQVSMTDDELDLVYDSLDFYRQMTLDGMKFAEEDEVEPTKVLLGELEALVSLTFQWMKEFHPERFED